MRRRQAPTHNWRFETGTKRRRATGQLFSGVMSSSCGNSDESGLALFLLHVFVINISYDPNGLKSNIFHQRESVCK